MRAQPTSAPNPMASSPPGLGLMAKAVFIHNGLVFGLPRGPEWSNHTLGKGGQWTPWPAIGAAKGQPRTLSIKTLRVLC